MAEETLDSFSETGCLSNTPTDGGSHHLYEHPERPDRIAPVPLHARDLERPPVKAIVKQAGLTEEELIELL